MTAPVRANRRRRYTGRAHDVETRVSPLAAADVVPPTTTITEDRLFAGYAQGRDHVLRVVVEERIAELWRYRQWWRTNRWADWPVERLALDVELRALVRLARRARAVTGPDPIDAANRYADWQDGAERYHDWQAR